MTTRRSGRITGTALSILGLLALLSGGCEKGDVLAPSDSVPLGIRPKRPSRVSRGPVGVRTVK